MNRILIIGGTGQIGRAVLSQLPAVGVQIRVLARNPPAAGLPPHVDVVRGDLTLPATLEESLDSLDTVWILRRARRIVFLSSPTKRRTPSSSSPIRAGCCTRKSSG